MNVHDPVKNIDFDALVAGTGDAEMVIQGALDALARNVDKFLSECEMRGADFAHARAFNMINTRVTSRSTSVVANMVEDVISAAALKYLQRAGVINH